MTHEHRFKKGDRVKKLVLQKLWRGMVIARGRWCCSCGWDACVRVKWDSAPGARRGWTYTTWESEQHIEADPEFLAFKTADRVTA